MMLHIGEDMPIPLRRGRRTQPINSTLKQLEGVPLYLIGESTS